MRMKSVLQSSALVLLAACAMGAAADDKSEYEYRSAARHFSLFHSLSLSKRMLLWHGNIFHFHVVRISGKLPENQDLPDHKIGDQADATQNDED